MDVSLSGSSALATSNPKAIHAMPSEGELTTLHGWGMAVHGRSQVHHPETPEQLAALFRDIAGAGQSLALRGSGCSYGDPALNQGGHVVDTSRMNRFLAFDGETGVVRVEPGVTLRELWRMAMVHGFWPKVVSGTMAVSVGGACAMNIHGKNNFRVGTFGEHVRRFELMLPSGERVWCSRDDNSELFYAAIGGFGMLGCFTQIELGLARVSSGRLRVTAVSTKNWQDSMEQLEHGCQTGADYMVGWIDMHARGDGQGRGLLHRADQLAKGEDPEGENMLTPEAQDVPGRAFGVVPLSMLWPGLWGALRSGAWGVVNAAKFHAGVREARRPPYLQTHGAFHFLLDYIPGWKRALLPGGLIQFQPFVPKDQALRVFTHITTACQEAGLVPYLGVLKRHRSDPFWMTHGLDGYSLALDFAVTSRNHERLWALCQSLADVVLEAGGKFYYAKDAVLKARHFVRNHGAEMTQKFMALKHKYDEHGLLQSDLWRRLTQDTP